MTISPIVEDWYKVEDVSIIEYKGNNFSDPNVILSKIETQKTSTKWIKKKADKKLPKLKC